MNRNQQIKPQHDSSPIREAVKVRLTSGTLLVFLAISSITCLAQATVPASPSRAAIALLRWYPANSTAQFNTGSYPDAVAFDGAHIWVATLEGLAKFRAADRG